MEKFLFYNAFLISLRGHVDFYPNQGRAPQPGLYIFLLNIVFNLA